ncbi:hypothetical protein ACFFX0_11320 [Citricoccus parietis]|uniref:Uncharacterized protein n=1 Tax=Citricoccus parietis TaxID=592307 RepID=A0ABV5FYJ9_9MICC
MVRDEHRGAPGQDLGQQLADLRDHLGVQGGQRLVQQHQLRPRGQHPGDRRALRLAAGHLPGPA